MGQRRRVLLVPPAAILLSVFILGAPAPAIAAASAGALPSPQMQVRLYNRASVADGLLGRAKAEAARILAKAGIETVWIDCPGVLSASAKAVPAVCDRRPGPREFALRLVSRGKDKRSSLGFALPERDGGFGSYASVFYGGVVEVASRHPVSAALVLGNVLAHEIGHLLLGRQSHSRTGVMSHPWGPKELRRMIQGELLFTKAQGRKMRSQAFQRQQAGQSLIGAASALPPAQTSASGGGG